MSLVIFNILERPCVSTASILAYAGKCARVATRFNDQSRTHTLHLVHTTKFVFFFFMILTLTLTPHLLYPFSLLGYPICFEDYDAERPSCSSRTASRVRTLQRKIKDCGANACTMTWDLCATSVSDDPSNLYFLFDFSFSFPPHFPPLSL